MRPFIGITTARVFINDNPFNRAYQKNADAIAKAGGLPVYIPTGLDRDTLREIYEQMDAILLPGGADLDPKHYGETQHPATKNIDADRDDLELTLARWQMEDDRPTFGICRGHQVLNVALGGTLVQDIPDEVGTTLLHDQPDGMPRPNRLHTINISPNSRLAAIMGTTQAQVNSLHHQSIEKPAPGAVITAYAPDQIVEALEVPDKRFMLSVQWHPEDLFGEDDAMMGLFKAFVDAAADYAAHRRNGR
jgi:putative glutamine amidotransferase